MQIIISIIFLHLWPGRRGNRAFPLSGSVRLQLVGILVPEPDGLGMLRHMFNKQACAEPASQCYSFEVARYATYIDSPGSSPPPSPLTPPLQFSEPSLRRSPSIHGDRYEDTRSVGEVRQMCQVSQSYFSQKVAIFVMFINNHSDHFQTQM